MDTRDFDRWVRLTLTLNDGLVAISYLDERGRRTLPHRFRPAPHMSWPGSLEPRLQALLMLVHQVQVSEALEPLLDEAVAPFLGFSREHLLPRGDAMQVPWLLPVFVDAPVGLEALPWEEWLRLGLFSELLVGDRCVLVRHRRARKLPPASLPWRISDARKGRDSVLQNIKWFRDEVRSHGIVFKDEPDASWPAGAAADVLFTQAGRPSARRAGTRLLVETDVAPAPWAPRAGIAILRVIDDGMVPQDPALDLLYALVHDFALHEVLWILKKTRSDLGFELACDAESNQGLRLTRTLQAMQSDILSGRIRAPGRFGPPTAGARLAALEHLTFDFSRETKGLTSLARFLAQAEGEAQPVVAQHQATNEPRRADLSFERYNPAGVPERMTRQDHDKPLRCGWRYRLGVRVGISREEDSLLEQPPPPLDGLLPPIDEGEHVLLEVCVFGKEFQVLSPTTQLLRIPRQGGDCVFFDLRAPHSPGLHDLRVVLYHHNNLLQSFLVRAHVEAPNANAQLRLGSRPERQLVAELTSAGVSDLGQASGLSARALSVALNHDAAPGQHTIMVKGSELALERRVAEQTLAGFVEEFQAVMGRAAEGARFEDSIRQLAKLGLQLFRLLGSPRPEEPSVLRQLTNVSGATVQFVRHDAALTIPWQIVYDLKLPQGDDFLSAPVCRADTPPGKWPPRLRHGCRHHEGPVVCMEGFWAFRHVLEQISEEQRTAARPGVSIPEQRATAVAGGSRQPLLTFGWSALEGLAQTLAAEWERSYQSRFLALRPGTRPAAECLWDERRPAVLVILSHMHPAVPARNLSRRLYACLPDDDELHEISAEALLDLCIEKDPLRPPQQPVVLLLACESGRRGLSDFFNFADGFLKAGCAAVIGTEWLLTGNDAVAFARHACSRLLADVPLGELMRDWYRNRLVAGAGNPFLFTAYGNADLQVREVA